MKFEVEDLPQEKLAGISALAKQLREMKSNIAAIEETLNALKKQAQILEERTLPDAMTELGLDSFTLAGGAGIRIRREYYPGIKVANREAVFKWLRENNCDAILKRLVTVSFGMGDDDIAENITQLLRDVVPVDTPFKDEVTIHPQTLRAFVRERIESKQPLPPELDVHTIDRAVIDEPK